MERLRERLATAARANSRLQEAVHQVLLANWQMNMEQRLEVL